MPIDAKQPYDPANIFARILRGEVPCKMVLESAHSLAFHDINPLAPIHVLVIRGALTSAGTILRKKRRTPRSSTSPGPSARWRKPSGPMHKAIEFLSNIGKRGGQEVPHLHVHVFGGAPLGPMLAR